MINKLHCLLLIRRGDLVKKYIKFIILVFLVVGLAGCRLLLSEEEKAEIKQEEQQKKEDMVTYMENKYHKKFTVDSDFIILDRGFGSGLSQDVIYVKAEDGLRTIVRERDCGDCGGKYFDDYIYDLVSRDFDAQMNYSQYPSIQFAKTYAYIKNEDLKVDEIMSGNLDTAKQNVSRVESIIFVDHNPNDEILKELYQVYQNLYKLHDDNFISVGFNGNKKKAKVYVYEYKTL